ncbi:MAG: hypothetical protein V1723_00465 [Candidatus Uhrbacteria bacterium]
MPTQTTEAERSDIRARAERIERTVERFRKTVADFSARQEDLLRRFVASLEAAKIEKIRKQLQ